MTNAAILRWLLGLTRGFRRRLLVSTSLGAVCTLCGIALLATAAYLIEKAAQQPPILSLTIAAVGVRFFSLARATSRYAERLVTHDTALRLVEATRVAVYRRLEPLAPAGLEWERSGDLLRRVVGDVDALQDFFARSLVSPGAVVIAGLIVLGVGLSTAPTVIAPLAVLLAVAAVLVLGTALATERRVHDDLGGLRGRLAAEVTELVEGCADLIALGAAADRCAAIASTEDKVRRRQGRLAWTQGAASGLIVALGALLAVAALALSVLAIHRGQLLSLGVGVVVLGTLGAAELLGLLPAAAHGGRRAIAAGRRLFAVTSRPIAVADGEARMRAASPALISVDRLSVAYATSTVTVDAISLELRPGRRVGLLGSSGSGKSTIAAALVGLRPIVGGSIRLDGVDVQSLRHDDIWPCVTLVEQSPHIFATSIRENLWLARRDATDEELRAVAQQVHLLDWIESLPDGWDTPVGQHGVRISGGQQRRLALARGLLNRAPFLIVDEPTEGLDTELAGLVMADLLAATRDRGLLVITHRPAELSGFDSVLRLHRPCAVTGDHHDERPQEISSRPSDVGSRGAMSRARSSPDRPSG